MLFRRTAALYAEVLSHSSAFLMSVKSHICDRIKAQRKKAVSVSLAPPKQDGWRKNWHHPAAEKCPFSLQIAAHWGRTRCFVLVVYGLRQHREGQNLADDARM